MGATTRYVEIASHREYVGSMLDACYHCGSVSIVAETYGTGLEIRCLHCCREQRPPQDIWHAIIIYVTGKVRGRSSYFD